MSESDFVQTTYTPTDHELVYLRDSLGEFFFDDQWITDILFKVKGGKEATVYCCAAHPSLGFPYIAAKVYRPRMFRAMRNDAFYRIGRTSVGPDGKMAFRGRERRAVLKHTAFGKKIQMASWNFHEFDLLKELHEAGADVPKPLAHGQNCILMEYLGDEVRGAPTLHSISLDAVDADQTFARIIRNIELMLGRFIIHGDLSAHNVLWYDGRPWLIDFPQAVSADSHPAAYSLLARDIDRVCRYFGRRGVKCDAGEMGARLWEKFLQQEL
jgi:RIO kinase 1